MPDYESLVTAKTFPLDPETGKFQSEPAELAYQAVRSRGIDLTRDQFRLVIQAYQIEQDKSQREYEEWKAKRAQEEAKAT